MHCGIFLLKLQCTALLPFGCLIQLQSAGLKEGRERLCGGYWWHSAFCIYIYRLTCFAENLDFICVDGEDFWPET